MGRVGNRFKFESFTKKIAKVGGEKALFKKELGGKKHVEETFFAEALEKWKEIDRGSHFYAFLKDIPFRDVGTYAQVIHYHKQIIQALLDHLEIPGSSSQIALLELCMALAKDLRDEFYHYMWEFFQRITIIMENADNNVELLETTHLTMALLFKQHWKSIVKESRKTFDRFLLLFASNKPYIRRFAAEAFAFLMRKISTIEKFARFMIEKAHRAQDVSLSDGIAMLIFNTVRGVNGNFHSCTDELLGEMLAALFSIEDPSIRNTGVAIMERAILYCLLYAKNDSFKNVSSVLMKSLETRTNSLTFCEALRLINAATEETRRKILFGHRELLLDVLGKTIKQAWFELNKDFFDLFGTLINRIYIEDKWKTKIRVLLDDLSTVNNFNDSAMISFLEALSNLSYFDAYIMPSIGVISERILQSSDTGLFSELLQFYAKLCSNRRPIEDVLKRPIRSTFFDVSLHATMRTLINRNIEHLNDHIEKPTGEVAKEKLLRVAQILLVWPWLTSIDDKFSGEQKVVEFLCSLLMAKVPRDLESFFAQSQIVLLAASALYQVDPSLMKSIDENIATKFVRNYGMIESTLRFYHLFVRARGINQSLDETVILLLPAFSSPCRAIRLCALEISASFDVPLEEIPLDENGTPLLKKPSANMFMVMASIEREEPTSVNFRDRMRKFRSLLYGGHIYTIARHRVKEFEPIILQVSLAQFYHQFTPIWTGMHEIILSYAKGLPIDTFWKEIEALLNHAILGLRKNTPSCIKTALAPFIQNIDTDSRTDFSAVIEQLCKLLQKVPEIAERRTKTLSPIFLDFFHKDYLLSEKPHLATENNFKELSRITETQGSDEIEFEDKNDQKMNYDESVHDTHFLKDQEISMLTKKMARKIMVAFLDLFASFRSPKMIFRQPEVYHVYNELLLSWDSDLQKAALKCLCTYKYKWLLPYKDNLLALLDRKAFRTELVNFNIGSDNSIVDKDHLDDFVPILLRLLYGRLTTPTSKMGHYHRLVIVRFIAGCTVEQLDHFISLLFHPFLKIFEGEKLVLTRLDEQITTETVKEQFSYKDIYITLETIENVLKGIAQKLSDKQRDLIYQLLISMMVILQRVIEATQEEQEIKMVKSLRRSIMERIRQFILSFGHCEWSTEQVKALWKWAVVPYTEIVHRGEKILTVAISSVLGIIAAIAQMPKLFHLLCAQLEVLGVSTCPLKIMIDSLLWEKTVPRYVNMIRLGIVSMLEYSDETQDANYGTSLLVTQLDNLLEYVIETLEKPSNTTIDGDILKILNGVSPFIKTDLVVKRFTFCLLQILGRKTKGTKPESIANLLSTFSSIVENLDDPSQVYCKLPKFFVIFDNRGARELLGQVCKKLANNQKSSSIDKKILNCLNELESWNGRKLDEPDFELRAKGFSQLTKLFHTANVPPNLDLLSTVAQSNAHTIISIDDIALRAQASLNLRDLIEFLAKPFFLEKEVFYTIDHCLLPLVIRGFRHEQQHARDEFIRALNVLVYTFPKHPHLSEMAKVKDLEDPDYDFFENAVHIQVGKRRAAFKILADRIKSHEVEINSQVLVAYFIPLLRHYMLNVTEKMSSVSDAALELLVAILKKTSWKAYIKIMDEYINQMAHDLENEKAYIRIVCAILDAFHFDATIAKEHQKRTIINQGEISMEVVANVFPEGLDADKNDEESHEITKDHMEQSIEPEVSSEIIYDKVVKNLIPKLKAAINGKLNPKAKDVHKLAMDAGQKHFQEDDDIRRAPITLAAVKVLLHMPRIVIDHHLHGIIMKLVELLVAKSDRVRETARKVMIQVVLELGSRYFPFVIREMEHVMQRGFQVHVLIYTTNSLIGVMRERLKPGDLDSCLDVIMKLCCEDLFYGVSEEKEVEAIRAKVPEAKSKRTLDTIENVGRFVGTQSLRTVLVPLYEVIDSKPTAKSIKTIGELLRHMAIGVKDNSGISVDNLLIFCHQLLSEHVAKMVVVQTNNFAQESKSDLKSESCLILPKEPRRIGEISKHSLKSRSHVFVEYALQLLAFILQDKRLDLNSSADIERLDPFVLLIAKCLSLKYAKVNSLALRCVYRMLPYPLPTLHANSKSLFECLFVLLADYSTMGNAGNKHTVLELNQILFKTFDGLIKISSSVLLDTKNIELLLNYVSTDVLDSAKQATAFALLKTIISKGIQHPMLVDVVKLLREQAILSEFPHVQAQCRLVIAAFVGQHPQSRLPKLEIEWWLEQLEYEHESGRLSASEMLNLFFGNFLPNVLDEISLLALVKIGSRLVNDSMPKCRRFCALSIKTLLSNVSERSRNEAFFSCIDWLNSEKEGNYAVAAGILMQLVAVEGEKFCSRATQTIEKLSSILSQEEALEIFAENTILSILEALTVVLQQSQLKSSDLSLTTFSSLLKILNSFCRCAQEMQDVRRAASELIGQCLTSLDPAAISLLTDPSPIELSSWMIFQLRATKLTELTAQQAIKNLLCLVSAIPDIENWKSIIEKIAKICHFEIRKLAEQAIRRLFLFKFCAALCMKFQGDNVRLDYIVECFMPFLTREMLKKSAKNTDELFNMANQVGDVIKGLIGEANWAELLSKNTRQITEKVEERKILKKEKVMAGADQIAKDRSGKYKKKAEAKKRKIDVWKPYRVGKRKRLEELRAQLSDEDN